MKKVKWGVIGCGGIADRRTIPGMIKAENAELVAVMDTNGSVAEKVGKKYGAKYSFDNIDDLLSVDEIEAVYIASPVFCHKEQAEKCVGSKKHILIEKPVGLDVSEAEYIKNIADKGNVLLGVGFMMRFHTYHQRMREIIQSGKIGEIVSARAQLTCWYPEMENCWRQNKSLSGGGAMMDMGIHCVDLLRYITGLEVSGVTGFTGNQIFKYNAEDAGGALMKLSNGAICYVDSNFNIPDSACRCKLEFYGTAGSIFAQGTIGQVEGGDVEITFSNSDLNYDANQNRQETKKIKLEEPLGNMYTKEIEEFGKAIRCEREIPINAEDAIKTQKIIEAVYKSNESGSFCNINY